MGRALMPKREQHRLDLKRLQSWRLCVRGEEEGLCFIRDALNNGFDFGAIGVAPKQEKRKPPKLFQEQSIGPRTGDTERKPAFLVEVEHERVGEDAADGAWLDVITLRRAPTRSERIPVSIEFDGDCELHVSLTPCSPAAPVSQRNVARPRLRTARKRCRDHAVPARDKRLCWAFLRDVELTITSCVDRRRSAPGCRRRWFPLAVGRNFLQAQSRSKGMRTHGRN